MITNYGMFQLTDAIILEAAFRKFWRGGLPERGIDYDWINANEERSQIYRRTWGNRAIVQHAESQLKEAA